MALLQGTTPVLRTNNQWLSVTDQLNLGVRVVEVDTHWFEGALRAAHCGGLHSKPLNELISILNSLSKLMGNRIRWDTETIGCAAGCPGRLGLVLRPRLGGAE